MTGTRESGGGGGRETPRWERSASSGYSDFESARSARRREGVRYGILPSFAGDDWERRLREGGVEGRGLVDVVGRVDSRDIVERRVWIARSRAVVEESREWIEELRFVRCARTSQI
jgi:hypothetical protein